MCSLRSEASLVVTISVSVLQWVLLASLLAAGCSEPEVDVGRSLEADVESARARAVGYFAAHVEGPDPSWASLFGYMHRRFGLEAADARGRPLHAPAPLDAAAGWAAIYRRLDDPGATLSSERVAAIASQTDRMTALALHCDTLGTPENWPDVLRAASDAGGYALTHAALATRWTLENGCMSRARLADVEQMQRDRLALMATSRDALERTFANGTDLWLESMSMLYYLEGGDRIDPAMLREVIALQRPDGGWPAHAKRTGSDPHATALALWVLLENERPDTAPIQWIAPR